MIRAYQPADLDVLYDICLDTGNGGQGARTLVSQPRLLGDAFVGPYVHVAPELGFVAVDDLGVCGYAIAAADTIAFEEQLERDWWPHVRPLYPQVAPRSPYEGRIVDHFHDPVRVDPALAAEFPAHMHANLLPRAKGKGFGGALCRAVLDRLEKGAHVHVRHENTHGIGFWQHLGFREVESGHKLVLGLHLSLTG